jgi:hypothetical protein
MSETDKTPLNNLRNNNLLNRGFLSDLFSYLSVSVNLPLGCENAIFYGHNLLKAMVATGLMSINQGIGLPQVVG